MDNSNLVSGLEGALEEHSKTPYRGETPRQLRLRFPSEFPKVGYVPGSRVVPPVFKLTLEELALFQLPEQNIDFEEIVRMYGNGSSIRVYNALSRFDKKRKPEDWTLENLRRLLLNLRRQTFKGQHKVLFRPKYDGINRGIATKIEDYLMLKSGYKAEDASHLTAKSGPRLADGRVYTAEQVLAMSPVEFTKLHRSTRLYTAVITRFLSRFSGTISEVLSMPYEEAVKKPSVGPSGFKQFADYMVANYRLKAENR